MAFDSSGWNIFPRGLQLALSGELEAYLEAADEAVLQAARNALVLVTSNAKDRLRSMVERAGLAKQGTGSGRGSGRSLASAIRVDIFPKQGLARSPAALVYIQPSAAKIYESFEKGSTLTSSHGKYFTIPVPGSPADRKNFGDRPRGQSVLDAFKARGIELSFVPGNGRRPAMLVASSARLREGRGARQLSTAKRLKSGKMGAGATSIPLFFLVPQVNIPKRLDMQREFERTAREFIQAFATEFAKQLARLASSNTLLAS